MAQSSVTLFGLLDARVARGDGSVSSKTQLANSGIGANRLGFKGVEDLGGGLSASFWLEAAVSVDSGAGTGTDLNNQGTLTAGSGLTFSRRSTVSLNGPLGELRLGRDYTPQIWNQVVFDPFGFVGVGITQLGTNIGGPTNVRASNSIGYLTPATWDGFYGQAMYFLGENPSGTATSSDGTGGGLRLGYAKGPVNMAVSTSLTKYFSGNTKMTSIGGSYDFGPAKVEGLYEQDTVSGRPTAKGWMLGAIAPVGVGQFKASYSTYKGTLAGPDRRTDKLAVGYVYNLSKRTAVYATVAHLSNKNGASEALNGAVTGANGSSTGYDIGLRTSF